MNSVLRVEAVTHRYPGALALDDVSFDLLPGEVHALVGENGAGKSTLINVVSGVVQPDAGEMLVAGEKVVLRDPVAARQAGIATVHQEAEFFSTLSVAENMALFHGLPTSRLGQVRWSEVYEQAAESIELLNAGIDVRVSAAELSVAQRHMTQLASAVLQKARIVILDEPTSALSQVESQWLFEHVRKLRADGVGVIYISHRQDEIFQLADRITVLRDGRHIWTGAASETTREEVIRMMVGRDVEAEPAFDRKATTGVGKIAKSRLKVTQLADAATGLHDVSFEVGGGEVVGVYGLIGAGRSELAHHIFGLTQPDRGTIEVDGQPLKHHSPADSVEAGVVYVPEDRLKLGVCRSLSVRANCVLSSLKLWMQRGLTNRSNERRATDEVVKKFQVRLHNQEQSVGQLSGGNQQKVVLGRWLLCQPKVFLLDEPTRGVDVGAKAEIHQIIRQLANDGSAVLMISSDLPEITQHSDRILVFREGTISAEFKRDALAEDIATAALPHLRQSADSSDSPASSQPKQNRKRRLPPGPWALLGVIVTLMLSLAVTTTDFFTVATFVHLLTNASLWALLGLAAATVIIAGGIDISIGSLLALCAATAGLILQVDLPTIVLIPLAIAAALLVGTAGGLLNASIALWGRVHPIVVTLGTMSIYRGLVILLMEDREITNVPRPFEWLAQHSSGFRSMIPISAIVVGWMAWWLFFQRSGRHLFAVGASRSAAHQAGISHGRVWLTAFGVGGLMAGIAGVLQLAQAGQMQSNLAQGWELAAIAVAVIGGTSITGGKGSVAGVLLGAVLLALLESALVRWNVPQNQVTLFVGALILVAVLPQVLVERWRK